MRPTNVSEEDCVQFVPSRVEGIDGIREVVVFADRVEIQLEKEVKTYQFESIAIAKYGNLKHLWRRLWQRECYVGERDWFHEPQDRFFRFYTEPSLVIYMPVNDSEGFMDSHFGRIRELMRTRGYATFDLG